MNVDKRYLSANEFLHDSWRLASRILKSGWRPDALVALWRGGAPVGVAVHEFLKVSGVDVKHIPVKCTSYSAIGENAGEVRFTCEEIVFGMFRAGDKVLVVDDVFDTGKTAAAVKRRFDALGVEMRFGAVYYKPEKNVTDIVPDYWVRDVGREWLVFPHEIEGLSEAEIAEKDPLLSELLASAQR